MFLDKNTITKIEIILLGTVALVLSMVQLAIAVMPFFQ
jgi:hypothetical protein